MRRCAVIASRRGYASAKPETSQAVGVKKEESIDETATQKVATPATVYRPPYYRKIHKTHESKHLLQDEFPNAGDASGAGLRLFDYFKTAEMVEKLPTIKEKVDFVSPYERPWTRAERTWRREWHPSLMATRKAWCLPSVPAYFDVLQYYQNLTKTRVEIGSLDDVYKGLLPPTAHFEKAYNDTISSVESGQDDDSTQKLLGMIVDDAMGSLVHNVHRLADRRVSYDVANEAFWIRSGFMFLYDEQEIGTQKVVRRLTNFPKYIGDDRRKLGELAFVHRDKFAAQIRSREPLSHLHSLDNEAATRPVFDPENAPDLQFSPKVYNLWSDEKPLWQCPGYHVDVDESHKHGVVAFKSLDALKARVEQWTGGLSDTVEAQELFTEGARAQAVISLFSTLCAQAHAHGFTQYTDVTHPFTSQLVLTDGNKFFFAVGQLNTLAINVECDGFHNPRTNLVRVEGPFDLFEQTKEGKETEVKKTSTFGFNPKVTERILQMIMKQ